MKIIKMIYSIEPRDKIYVKGYGNLSFAKNMGENLSNKYRQKTLDSAKKITEDAKKTPSKRAIQKTGEPTGDLIGNKIVDKILSVSKKSWKDYKIMKQSKMKKELLLLLKKDTYLQKKDKNY